MDNAPSFASLLVKESPRMHYGHGWINTADKRWHPSRSQTELLAGLSSKKQGESWLLKLYRKLNR